MQFCADSTLAAPTAVSQDLTTANAVQGLAKNIGVSNMSIKKLKDVLTYAKVVPAINQVEVHPYFRNQELIEYCASQGVHVTAYSSLGTPSSAGHLVKKSAPNPSHVSHATNRCHAVSCTLRMTFHLDVCALGPSSYTCRPILLQCQERLQAVDQQTHSLIGCNACKSAHSF